MLELHIRDTSSISQAPVAMTILPGTQREGSHSHPAILFHSMQTMRNMFGAIIEAETIPAPLTPSTESTGSLQERLLERRRAVATNILMDRQGSADRPLAAARMRIAPAQALDAAHPFWPINYHNMRSYSFWNGTIRLEDGSDWSVSSIFTVLSWSVNDPIILQPNWNYPLFSDYQYLLINQATGASVGANLTLTGPEYYGANSHWITSIDYFLGRIYLENGSYWSVSPEDDFLLQTWAIGDHVIIGEGSGWIYDSIIINYNQNHYIYAFEF